jgi:hypothetical protein
MRVSDDGRMALVEAAVFAGSKEFYATREVIDAANARLRAVESPYQLLAGRESIQGRTPWTWNTNQTLYRVVPSDTRGGSGPELRTLENCSAHGLDSMGIGVDAGAQRRSNREFRIDTGGGQTMRNTGDSGHAESDQAARNIILAKIHRHKNRLAANVVVNRADANRTYGNLNATERRTYARMFGINEFAAPLAGDGIEALRSPGDAGGGGFPMHFAAVVARSGNDYITLENFAKSAADRARGDTVGASRAWYFRMYGPYKSRTFWWDEDQSYSGEHAVEGSIHNRANIMGLANRNTAKAPALAPVRL